MGYGLSKSASCLSREAVGQELGARRIEFLEEDDASYEIRRSYCSSSDDDSPSGVGARSHNENLIIFDWDDTLLCTTAINSRCWMEGQLQQLERAAEQLLRLAMQLGDTIIVTNGKPMWVKESCQHFLPGLLPLVEQLPVISARARFEHLFPNDPFAWKRQTFRKILQCRHRQAPENLGLNLVVLGDSHAEIEAARTATELVSGCRVLIKTVKLRSMPSCAQLVGQLRKVKGELEKIVGEGRSASKLLVLRDLSPSSWRTPGEASAWRMASNKTAGSPWSRALRASSEAIPGKASKESTERVGSSIAKKVSTLML